MPTTNQLIHKSRLKKKKRKKKGGKALQGNPQLKGTVLSQKVIKPKKPNSAQRPVARVKLSNGREVTVHIPGTGGMSPITVHSEVLIRGGRTPDLPGVKYKVVPGALGHTGSRNHYDQRRDSGVPRRKSRSKYGVKLREN